MKITLIASLFSLFASSSFASPPCGPGGSCSGIVGCPRPDVPTCVDGRCTCRPGAGVEGIVGPQSSGKDIIKKDAIKKK